MSNLRMGAYTSPNTQFFGNFDIPQSSFSVLVEKIVDG